MPRSLDAVKRPCLLLYNSAKILLQAFVSLATQRHVVWSFAALQGPNVFGARLPACQPCSIQWHHHFCRRCQTREASSQSRVTLGVRIQMPFCGQRVNCSICAYSRGVPCHARQYSAPEMLPSSGMAASRDDINLPDTKLHPHDISFLRGYSGGPAVSELSRLVLHSLVGVEFEAGICTQYS